MKLLINLKLILFVFIFVGNACREDIATKKHPCYFPCIKYLEKRSSFDKTVCSL